VIAWLRRDVARAKVATGPGFEWLADDAVWRSSTRWPPPQGAPIVATGSGTLLVNPADAVQVIGGSQVYGPVRGAAAITISGARLELPIVGPAGLLPSARRCRSRRRFTIRIHRPAHTRLRSAKVWVAGKRVYRLCAGA
jgi:hypothetical protein